MTYNFQKQLEYSQRAGDEPFWDAFYRKAFPNLVNHMPCPGDFFSQRMGIDRVILLSNGERLTVDEKKRDRAKNGKIYTDVLLEFLSNDKSGAKGWIEKDLAINYLAYAIMPIQTVYLFDWLTLRRAWIANRDRWLKTCFIAKTPNDGYYTHSVAVKLADLQKSVCEASVIRVDFNQSQLPRSA